MRYIDLFAGIGGFHYGISRLNRRTPGASNNENGRSISNSNSGDGNGRRTNPFTCVYSNEWDKYANSVYRRHYGECDNRDIRTVPTSDIPDHDLLCGGFPCQSFSVAGKRGGFNDTRGTMFFEIARILADKRPRYLLLENVKGLLSHDSGKTFQTILGVLSDLGYGVQWQVLNSKDFGVPQNRERVFIVGHLRGTSRPEVFPLSGTATADTFSRTVRSGGRGSLTGKHRWDIVRQPLRFLNRNQKNIEGDYAFTVDSSQTSGIKQGAVIRRLTPKETMRLQGFPDQWCDYGADGEIISDTQKYKMAGNAVTTNVITAIVERLL